MYLFSVGSFRTFNFYIPPNGEDEASKVQNGDLLLCSRIILRNEIQSMYVCATKNKATQHEYKNHHHIMIKIEKKPGQNKGSREKQEGRKEAGKQK